MEFLKDILCGKKQYFLLQDVIITKVPLCPELTVERVLNQVKAHKVIM
jgi:hypothetical protein